MSLQASGRRVVSLAIALSLVIGPFVACAEQDASQRQQLWVADNYVQCNEFDEPFRECLLVSHSEFGLYRHLEGPIEGFDYEEGTKYLLEVERTDEPLDGEAAPYRLLSVVSTED